MPYRHTADGDPPVGRDASGLRAHALLIGDRLSVDRTERSGVVSTAPFCFRRDGGFAVIFRYGAVVLVGMTAAAEASVLAELARGGVASDPIEEEQIRLEIGPAPEEGPTPGGALRLAALTAARALVVADVLAKSVALARYEKEIGSVFDTIEPPARALADNGAIPRGRKGLLQMIGSALLVQHRVSGRIAFAEKPDVLWENPELERLYARLEDEYEIVERGTLLNGKMGVIAAAAQTFTDLVDTQRSTRLEMLVVGLILAELVITVATLFRG
jgi:uncharacterized Rmd1/YagE family protein